MCSQRLAKTGVHRRPVARRVCIPTPSTETPVDESKLTRVATILEQTLDGDRLMSLGRQTGFMKRSRTVTADALANALVTAMATQEINTIADFHRFFVEHSGRDVRYKPLHLQLSKAGFAAFMKEVLGLMLNEFVTRVLRPIPSSVLQLFEDGG